MSARTKKKILNPSAYADGTDLYLTCGISGDRGSGGDVSGDDGPSADDRSFADRHAAEYGGAAADAGAALHQRGYRFPIGLGLQLAASVGGARNFVVDEGDVVSDENFVFNGHALADKRMARDFAVPSDSGALLNLNE